MKTSQCNTFPRLFTQMSLADELLADLEEAGEEGEDGLYPGGEEDQSDGESAHREGHGGLEDIPEEMETSYSNTECVTSIAKLRNSKSVSAGHINTHGRGSVCLLGDRLGKVMDRQEGRYWGNADG